MSAAGVFIAWGLGALVLVFALALLALQYRPPQWGRPFESGPVLAVADDLSWTNVGGDPGHSRFSRLAQVTPANVGRLRPAWTYRTGEVGRRGELIEVSKFQNTPILAAGSLMLCTPFNRVIALDPASGQERWSFDPNLNVHEPFFNHFNCRGVAQWRAATADEEKQPCGWRILTATNDRRLIALDARTGQLCSGFGQGGSVKVVEDRSMNMPGEVQLVAAPAVAGDVVVVGSSVADNQYAAAASGAVRAYDVRSGRPLWTFDPVRSPDGRTGGGNVWSSISVDPARGLVFLPTSSPSPDFYGGGRSPDSPLTNAVVAVEARSGRVVWSFQTVRHDLWDYDVPAAPTLFDLEREGQVIPALAFATKPGFVFVLDRRNGQPLFPVEDRRVPASDVPGERAASTQPISRLPVLAPQRIGPDDAFGLLGFDRAACARQLASLRNEGLFTPPSLKGTAVAPTTGGGANWGGVTIDPLRQRLFVNSSRAVEVIRLAAAGRAGGGDHMSGGQPQRGAPYSASRGVLLSPLGLPCNHPPWGALTALDLRTGKVAWEEPLGTTSDLAPLGISLRLGTPNLGGSVVTQGGLLFIAAAMDRRLRAFDAATGRELWSARLPAGAQATPMTYAIGGRQYVVVVAGGHSVLNTPRGDYVTAFALPRE